MPFTDDEKKKERAGGGADAARDSFSETDRKIAAQNPEYGEKLALIKQNYNSAQTDAERAGWHDEAEKLSRAYGYSRNSDGTVLTPTGAQDDASVQRQNVKSNLETIKAFNDKYAGGSDKNGYQAVINSLLSDIAGAKFTYSAEDDPRYVLAQEYAQNAMKNQMAESAALSGGYGNSYAANVGQMVYDDYMEEAANNLEDRAYARFQDEQADRYNRLGLLRAIDDTLYSREQSEREWDYRADLDAAEDGRYADETAYAQNQTAKNEAQSRINAFLEAGGDIEKLDPALVKASGFTSAELEQAKQYYRGLQIQSAMQAADGLSAPANNTFTSLAAQSATPEMDYDGLFTDALSDEYSAKTFINNNYKQYGFSSSSGLYEAFEEWRDENDGDISQAVADSYLQSISVPLSGVATKKEFYEKRKTIDGKKYDTYSDYIDDCAESYIQTREKAAEKFSRLIPEL